MKILQGARCRLTQMNLELGESQLIKKGGLDAVMAQSGNEGGTLPVAVQDGTEATLAQWAATVVTNHLGVQTRFIDKDKAPDIPVGLLPAPQPPGGFRINTILLGGARRFFL
jgi:hypothetical protein